jgi:LmbE family N-acetylglucosaminyl deacetylase
MDASELRLLCVLAHPDDESLGTGGALATYAAEGVATFLVTATRGERGRYGDVHPSPGPEVVGAAREAELLAAARELGLKEVSLLGYPDGALDTVDAAEAIAKIAGHLRRIKPHVVVSFGPDGGYGHPDHIAISQLTAAALACAADPSFAAQPAGGAAHRVSKFYFIAWRRNKWNAYEAALRKLVFTVDGEERQAVPWADWAITTVIDTSRAWATVKRAVACHNTQMAIYAKFDALPEDQQRALWGTQEFYRVFSVVNAGRRRETDLFEGLR